MTQQHFTTLSKEVQHRNLLVNGVCLASRETRDCRISLFQLGDFYVELYLDKDCGIIIYSRSFQNTEELYPYLDQIDIAALVKS
jgi:hypothetical protein